MPKKFVQRTKQQNGAIHALLNKFNFTDDDKAEMVFEITSGRTEHSSEMSVDEANVMLKRLGGLPINREYKSRRAENYHRQAAGIKPIVTPEHLDKLDRLRRGRGMTESGLESMCLRTIKVSKPRTAQECSKIIEAIKAMNSRDRAFDSFKKDKKEAA